MKIFKLEYEYHRSVFYLSQQRYDIFPSVPTYRKKCRWNFLIFDIKFECREHENKFV